MKKPFNCSVLNRIFIAAAVVMIIFALGAGSLGVDTDQKWGPFRKGLFVLGLVVLVIPLLNRVVDAIDRYLISNSLADIFRSRFTPLESFFPVRLRRLRPVSEVDAGMITDELPVRHQRDLDDGPDGRFNHALRSLFSSFAATRGLITLVLIFIVVELLYIGLVSVWHWTEWPATSDHYGLLADAFAHGQAALLIEPSPLLAELQNPYPLSERQGIPAFSDASYFRGKYYFYWGPAPAVLVALWKLATGRVVGDEHIVFLAVNSVFIFSTLIILYLRRKYFPSLPDWLFAIGVVIVATAHPMLWILNHPTVYEAAIASGQAFLIAGLYFALPILSGSNVRFWRLVLVGVLWSLVLGSRLTLLGAVAVLAVGTVMGLVTRTNGRRQWKDTGAKMAALAVPLALGIGLLGLYNFIRFGSFLETGFRYALAPRDLNLMMQEGQIFNIVYFLPNLLYYFITPLQFISLFPFVRPLWGQLPVFSSFLKRFDLPAVYRVESATGLLFAMPTILLSGFLVKELLCGQTRLGRSSEGELDTESESSGDRGLRRTLWIILTAGILAAAPIFLFFFVATRYLLDAIPLLTIITVVGTWQLYSASRAYPLRRSLAILLILTGVVVATLVSFLLALSGADSRFDDQNPVLFKSLVEFFSR